MIDVEREIRDALRRHQREVPELDPADTPAIVRRTRVRQARNGIGAMVLAALFALGATTGVNALFRAELDVPAVTPTPTPTDPVEPAVVPGDSEPTGAGLYVLDPATGEATILLHGRRLHDGPVISPDGTRFAFAGRTAGGPPQIVVLESDGTERPVTDLAGGARDPDWSPDGTRIAFAGREPDADIYVVNADGSGLRLVGGSDGVDVRPDWSPDGTRIAFERSGGRYGAEIWIVGVENGETVRLTLDEQGDGDHAPTWSPDGGRIAFLRFEDAPGGNLEADDEDLWVMDADGSNQHRLVDAEGPNRLGNEGSSAATPDGHWQYCVVWSPDGRLIAWSDIHNGVSVLDIATQEIRRVTSGFASDLQWTADGIVAGWAPYRE